MLHFENILGLVILVQVTIVSSTTNDYSVNLFNLFCLAWRNSNEILEVSTYEWLHWAILKDYHSQNPASDLGYWLLPGAVYKTE